MPRVVGACARKPGFEALHHLDLAARLGSRRQPSAIDAAKRCPRRPEPECGLRDRRLPQAGTARLSTAVILSCAVVPSQTLPVERMRRTSNIVR